MSKPFTLSTIPANTNARPAPEGSPCYSCREAPPVVGLLCAACAVDLARLRGAASPAPNTRPLPAEVVCSSCREARPVRGGLCADCYTDLSGVFDVPRGQEERPAE